jgi:D-ribose pyranose/furanose isomerase RbsD
VDQIVAKLRKADVDLGKGKNVPSNCKLLEVVTQCQRTDVLTLASEVRWQKPEMASQL